MVRAFIGVGSNIDPERNVRESIVLLAAQIRVTGISTVYRTAPEDRPEQPSYYNCVVAVETEANPWALKDQILRPTEETLGRKRSADKYAPRTIDLDLIVYDDLALSTWDLILPDPQILRRPFLAFPLQELAPGLTLPGLGLHIEEVTAALSPEGMERLENYTELLRREILHGNQYSQN